VENDVFSDAALVLLGHGSTVHPGAAQPVLQHAAELRRRRLFAEVREAFWKQEPQVVSVLSNLPQSRVVIVPLFMSEGYFSEEIIPFKLGLRQEGQGTLGRCREDGRQTVFYSRPVGTHVSMTSVVLDRARKIVEAHPFPRAPKPGDITLFIAGHGTEQNEGSRLAVELQADFIRALGVYGAVEALFLEEPPRIEECYRLARTHCLVVVPFFISDGMHVLEDIPIRLGQPSATVRLRLAAGQPSWRNPTEHEGRLVWYSPSVGTDPCLAEVILERARECLGGRKPGV
jgi:sirohydrochlorin cobaltochelatase